MQVGIRRMVKWEWKLLRAEGFVWSLIAVCAVMAAFAALNGGSWSRFQARNISQLRAEETHRLDSLRKVFRRLAAGDTTGVTRANDPRSPAVAGRAVAGRWLVLPPGPLAPLAIGQSDLYPYFVRLSSTTRQATVVNEEIDNPLALMTGRLDMTFVILVLYPLLVLALTYNVVSQEREQGTLALILAQPVNGRAVLLTKLGVRASVMILLAVVLSVTAALATGVDTSSGDVTLRLFGWVAVVIVYGLFWVSVAVAANAGSRSSAANAVMVLAVWFAVVIAIPAVVSALIASVYPVPSRIMLATALREAQNDLAAKAPPRASAMAEYLAEHPQYRSAGTADTNDPQVVAVAMSDQLERKISPVFAEFDARVRARQDAGDNFRVLSPALAAHGALLDLAGTGPTRNRSFEDLWVSSHSVWRQFFNSRLFAGANLGAQDIDLLPRPAWVEERFSAIANRVALSLMAILVPALLLTFWGWRRRRLLQPV